jgi:UDP:flavonoid glycosyltransferase YjiC (YdhE family)
MGRFGDELGGGPSPPCGIGPLGLTTSDAIRASGEVGGPVGKRVVITTFGSFGDLNPYIGLALGLKARGHDPVIATAELYRHFVEAEEVGFRPIRPDRNPHDIEAVRRILNPGLTPEYLMRGLLFPRLQESYEDLSAATRGADALLTHPLTFAGPLVAEKVGIPWASTVLAPISFFSAHELPALPVLPRLAVVLRRLGPGAGRALVGLAKRATRHWPEPVRRLRTKIGLSPGKHPIYEGQFSPELVLAMFSRVLAEPQPDWPPNSRITGQVFYDGSGHDGLSPDLERFLASGPAPVVFTLGTSVVGKGPAADSFYRESLKAARILKIRSLFLVGKDPKSRLPVPLPEGVAVVDRAPFSRLFPRAAAVVHQGGIGTVGHALRAGRPQLVVPFAVDQPDNAQRVQRLGVAEVLYPRRYAAHRAARQLGDLLRGSGYARRAGEVAERVRSEDGIEEACDAIEELLASSRRGKA